jgi:hypothetical protein
MLKKGLSNMLTDKGNCWTRNDANTMSLWGNANYMLEIDKKDRANKKIY